MREPIIFDITIKAGANYAVDFVYEEDDGTPVSVEGWTAEAQLREFPEARDKHDFVCTADADGFHLTMSHDETSKIGYTRGVYDVFIIAPDSSVRERLIQGRAMIIPEATR